MRVAVLIDLEPDARYATARLDALTHAAAALGRDVELRACSATAR